uniref:Putative ovule protein n=1 Tax=Solanum chacoense TaxID=4108 RepID=A0A0V0ILB3_SOLCH
MTLHFQLLDVASLLCKTPLISFPDCPPNASWDNPPSLFVASWVAFTVPAIEKLRDTSWCYPPLKFKNILHSCEVPLQCKKKMNNCLCLFSTYVTSRVQGYYPLLCKNCSSGQ